MIIEMLLNNNTQIYFWSNDFTFSKNKNVIVYIIEKVLKYILIISIGQNVNKIWNFKVNVCVMVKMKYKII